MITQNKLLLFDSIFKYVLDFAVLLIIAFFYNYELLGEFTVWKSYYSVLVVLMSFGSYNKLMAECKRRTEFSFATFNVISLIMLALITLVLVNVIEMNYMSKLFMILALIGKSLQTHEIKYYAAGLGFELFRKRKLVYILGMIMIITSLIITDMTIRNFQFIFTIYTFFLGVSVAVFDLNTTRDNVFKFIRKYSYIFLSGVLTILFVKMDQFIIYSELGSMELGKFTIPLRITELLVMLVTMIANAKYVDIFDLKNMTNREYFRSIKVVMNTEFKLAGLGIFIMFVCAIILGANYLIFIVLFIVMTGNVLLSKLVIWNSKEIVLVVRMLILLMVHVSLSYALINELQVWGVILSLCFTQILNFILLLNAGNFPSKSKSRGH